MITYEFRVTALCPEGDGRDLYEVQLEREEMLLVEVILEALDHYVDRRAYQEALTAELAEEFGGAVTTVGWHSGVKVRCRVEP